MKSFVFLTVFCLFSIQLSAQVGIGTNTPHTSAKLEVSSTTQGFLPPRMTAAERNTIFSPTAGLIIWCSNCGTNGELQVFNGTAWTNITGGSTGISTVVIGNQQWMAENLNVSTFRDGTPIPHVTTQDWQVITTPAWCWYNNDPAQGAVYGRLYNWYAVADSRGLCPTGWHVPTNAEWTTLSDFLGGFLVAGGKMKTTGTTRWNSPNTGATNSSRFSALPGGIRGNFDAFANINIQGNWWTATQDQSWSAFTRYIENNSERLFELPANKERGRSVRCVKD